MRDRHYRDVIATVVGIAIALSAMSCQNMQAHDNHPQDWNLIEASEGKIFEPNMEETARIAEAVDSVIPRLVWPSQIFQLKSLRNREYLTIIERYPPANPDVSFVRIHLTMGRTYLSSCDYYCGKEDLFHGLQDFVVQQHDPEWGDLLVGRYFDEGKTNRIIFAIKEPDEKGHGYDFPGEMIRLRRETADGTILADDEFNKTLDPRPSK